MSTSHFPDLLSPAMLANLDSLGYQNMTPIQQASLPAILNGQDLTHIECQMNGSDVSAFDYPPYFFEVEPDSTSVETDKCLLPGVAVPKMMIPPYENLASTQPKFSLRRRSSTCAKRWKKEEIATLITRVVFDGKESLCFYSDRADLALSLAAGKKNSD